MIIVLYLCICTDQRFCLVTSTVAVMYGQLEVMFPFFFSKFLRKKNIEKVVKYNFVL